MKRKKNINQFGSRQFKPDRYNLFHLNERDKFKKIKVGQFGYIGDIEFQIVSKRKWGREIVYKFRDSEKTFFISHKFIKANYYNFEFINRKMVSR